MALLNRGHRTVQQCVVWRVWPCVVCVARGVYCACIVCVLCVYCVGCVAASGQVARMPLSAARRHCTRAASMSTIC